MTQRPPARADSGGERLRELLATAARRLGDRAVLWRGEDLGGSDVDLLVTPDGEAALTRLLAGAGLRPAPGDPGHVVWSGRGLTPIDVLHAPAWPSYYPSLAGVLGRLERGGALPPRLSAADRALVLAAEAVAGKPLEKVHRRAAPAVAAAGGSLGAVAAEEGLSELAQLISGPGELARRERRGRLPYPAAVGLALRSGAARAALRTRLASRAAALTGRPAPRPRDRGDAQPLLLALSGMDGAGKSTAAEVLRQRLEVSGLPAEIAWARIGGESALLDRLAGPVKRVLGRRGTVADPIAAGGPAIAKTRDPREEGGRRRLTSWAWIVIVAWANARSYRAAAAARRRGVTVVCDRWATDALVDLELRYGRHGVARAVLRHLPPRPDMAILLEIDAATAAARKPGDQARWVLDEMERLYVLEASASSLTRVDARLPREDVQEHLGALVDALVARGRDG